MLNEAVGRPYANQASNATPMPVDEDVMVAREMAGKLHSILDYLRRKRDALTAEIQELEKQVNAMNPQTQASLTGAQLNPVVARG